MPRYNKSKAATAQNFYNPHATENNVVRSRLKAQSSSHSTSNATQTPAYNQTFSSHSFIYRLTCENNSTCDSLLESFQNNTGINATALTDRNCSAPVTPFFQTNCTAAAVPVALATCGNSSSIANAVLLSSALNFLCELPLDTECSEGHGFDGKSFGGGFALGIGVFAILFSICAGIFLYAEKKMQEELRKLEAQDIKEAIRRSKKEIKIRNPEQKSEEKYADEEEYKSGHSSVLGLR